MHRKRNEDHNNSGAIIITVILNMFFLCRVMMMKSMMKKKAERSVKSFILVVSFWMKLVSGRCLHSSECHLLYNPVSKVLWV